MLLTITLTLVCIICVLHILRFIMKWRDNYRINKMLHGEITFRQYLGLD